MYKTCILPQIYLLNIESRSIDISSIRERIYFNSPMWNGWFYFGLILTLLLVKLGAMLG